MSFVFINYPLETFTPTHSGALATVIWECCRRAQKQGIQPYVITRDSVEPKFAWPRTTFIRYNERPRNSLESKYLRAERKFKALRHLRYSVYVRGVIKMLHRPEFLGRPVVLMNDPEMAVLLRRHLPDLTIMHWFFNHMECKPKFRERFASSVSVHAAVSNFTGRFVASYYNLQDTTIKTLYIAADHEKFHPSVQMPGLPVINFVGRTGIEKAPDLLLRAAIRLIERTNAFSIQILGANHWGRLEMDDYQRQLAEVTSILECNGICVRRPGHIGREQLPHELRQAHIHVMPSRWDEPFALATLEGMASGLATIASRTGGTPEAVGDGGFLFERDSEAELSEHLYNLVTHPRLRAEYGQKARLRAQEFTWERTWAELRELLRV